MEETENGNTLVISLAEPDDAGEYTCQISASRPTELRHSVQIRGKLTIIAKLRVYKPPNRNNYILRGKQSWVGNAKNDHFAFCKIACNHHRFEVFITNCYLFQIKAKLILGEFRFPM